MKVMFNFSLVLFACALSACGDAFEDAIDRELAALKTSSQWQNAITVSNVPSNIQEGTSIEIGVRYSMSLKHDAPIVITSSDPAIVVNGTPEASISFSPYNSTVEKKIVLSASEDQNLISEKVTITFSSEVADTISFTVTAVDNDVQNIVLTGDSSVIEGQTSLMNVNLTREPSSDITVSIVSENPETVTVNPSKLTFNSQNYMNKQAVTLSGTEDPDHDSTTVSIFALSPGLESAIQKIVAIDNDTTIVFGGAISVAELSTSIIDVKLSGNPGIPRTVFLSSDNESSLTLQKNELYFTVSNYGTPQEIVINGVEDPNMTNEIVTISALGTGLVESGVCITVLDFNAPMNMAISPGDGTTGISPETQIELTFSESVATNEPWIVTIDGADYTSGMWEEEGRKLTINPSDHFKRGQTVSVTTSGFVSTYDGYAFDDQFVDFTIHETALVPGIEPAHGSEGISQEANIIITFPETVKTGNGWIITADGVTYDKNSNQASWNGEKTILTINPDYIFYRGSIVTVNTSGFVAEYDGYDVSDKSTSFTVSNVEPQVIYAPGNGETGVAVDTSIVLSFSEAVKKDAQWAVTVDGIQYDKNSPLISWNSEATELVINPLDNFMRADTIYISDTGFIAMYDDYDFGETSISFNTSSENQPKVISISPVNNAVDVWIEEDIVITFSEEMKKTNSWEIIIGVKYTKDSPNISWNGNVLTVNPASSLTMGKKYYVSLNNFTAALDDCPLVYTLPSFTVGRFYKVSDTGQTYDCTTTFGEDSDYANVPSEASYTGPVQHEIYTNDYTTIDNTTGLIWKTCAEGQYGNNCSGGASTYTVPNATKRCTDLNSTNSGNGYAGRKDWRVPTFHELDSIVVMNYKNPSYPTIDIIAFPNFSTDSFYWTSDSTAIDSTKNWTISFSTGRNSTGSNTLNIYYLKCVAGP